MEAKLEQFHSALFKNSTRLHEGTGILQRKSIAASGIKAVMEEKRKLLLDLENSITGDVSETHPEYLEMSSKDLFAVLTNLAEEHKACPPINLKAAAAVQMIEEKIGAAETHYASVREE